jgi:hypothetical protein
MDDNFDNINLESFDLSNDFTLDATNGNENANEKIENIQVNVIENI